MTEDRVLFHPSRLTPTMVRHLREMAALGPDAGWGPANPGEWRCAEALERRGLLQRNFSRGERPFSFTREGFEAARGL